MPRLPTKVTAPPPNRAATLRTWEATVERRLQAKLLGYLFHPSIPSLNFFGLKLGQPIGYGEHAPSESGVYVGG